MSLSQKDPSNDKGMNLHAREMSPSSRVPKNNKKKVIPQQGSLGAKAVHSRSNGINEDGIASGSTSPAAETEQGRTDAQVVHIIDKEEMSDSSAVSNPQSRPSPKQATRRDALKIKATITDSDSLKDQKDRQPPAMTTVVRPSRRKASRASQARKYWYRALIACFGLIFGLAVVAVTLAYAIGCESLSVEIQRSCDLVFQAGAGVTSAYIWILYTTQQLHQHLPTLHSAPRYSLGEQLGAGLGQTYTNLSQALGVRGSLHQAPAFINKHRAAAMRFQLPEESLTLKPLLVFLDQSVHIDEDLLRLIIGLRQTANLALRQQQLTSDTLRSIQRVQYFGTFESLKIYVVDISTQESQLKIRLEQHFRLLNEEITSVDEAARKVLQDYIKLISTTEEIRESSLDDRQRLLVIKEQTASRLNWVIRASIQLFMLPEPEDLAKISKNVELAQDIYQWAQNVVVLVHLLKRVTLHLQYAKISISSLIEIISKHGTVTWDAIDKNREIEAFLAQFSESVELLAHNTTAWVQLEVAGYI